MFSALLKSIVTDYKFYDKQIGGKVNVLDENEIYFLEEILISDLGNVPKDDWYYIKLIEEDSNNIIIYNSEKEYNNLEHENYKVNKKEFMNNVRKMTTEESERSNIKEINRTIRNLKIIKTQGKSISFVINDISYKTFEKERINLKEKISNHFNIILKDITFYQIKQDGLSNIFVNIITPKEFNMTSDEFTGQINPIIIEIFKDEKFITELKIEEITDNLKSYVKHLKNFTEISDKVFTNISKDTESLETSLDTFSDVVDQLRSIKIPSSIEEDTEKLSNLANTFSTYSTTVKNAIDKYDIALTYNSPTIVTPPLEADSDKYLSLYKEYIDNYSDVVKSIKAESNLPKIDSNLEEKNISIKQKISSYKQQIDELKSVTNEVKGKILIDKYLEDQKLKSISVRIAGQTYIHNISSQDLVFYNGVNKNLDDENIIPIEDISNPYVKKSGPELSKYLIEGVSNSIPADKLDLFILPELDKMDDVTKFNSDLIMKGGKNVYKINYTGGSVTMEAKKLISTTTNISKKLSEYNNNVLDLKKTIIELQDNIYNFNLIYIQIIFYHYFMVNIVSKNIISQEQMVYNLLSIGGCQYYLNIINVILKKIDSKNMSAAERYFQKYHYILLQNFKKLFEFIIIEKDKNNLTNHVFNKMESVIDVNSCKNRIKYLLVTFNNFKDLLDSYKSSKLPSVSIYARINDWIQNNNKDPFKRTVDENIFSRDDNDGQVLNINLENCGNLDKRPGLPEKQAQNDFKDPKFSNINKIKVEEVYDTKNFKDNGVISKYMSLPVQLSQKKGTMLITYGYSGVGKTFSLFGNGNLPGLLQTTLLEIRGQKSIKFRLFEIYGMGVQYNFYWKDKAKIYQKLYAYNLKKSGNNLVVGDNPNEMSNYEDMKDYINKTYKTDDTSTHDLYTDIDYSSFKNFSTFVGLIDDIRKKGDRITETPNNPNSSRSIIIYDFQIVLKDGSVVPFVIVDLPGKENIVESYIQNDKFKVKGDGSEEPAIAASIYLNPIFTPFYKQEYTNGIIKYIKDNKSMLSDVIEHWKNLPVHTITEKNINTNKVDNFFTYINNFVPKRDDSDWKNWIKNESHNTYLGPGDIQRYNNLLFYFIVSLIDLGKIDILVDLLSFITEKDIDGSKEEVRKKIRLAYEGVYINENILGMIFTMISKIKDESGNYKNPSYEIKSQKAIADLSKSYNERYDIGDRRAKDDSIEKGKYLKENEAEIYVRYARMVNRKIYDNSSNPDVTIKNKINFNIDKKNISLYKKSIDSYNPENIYSVDSSDREEKFIKKEELKSKEKSIMGDLLTPYIDDSDENSSIKNIYIFYLLTNNDPDRKCKNQIELLSGAERFIKALDPIE